MSRRLTERSIDHVVLERGEVANSGGPSAGRACDCSPRTGRPGSPATTTPATTPTASCRAATSRHPHPLRRHVAAPVCTGTAVTTVRAAPQGLPDPANDDLLCTRAVVLATGACTRPAIPAPPMPSRRWSPRSPRSRYRVAGQLPDGGVLVVGASATGVQLAAEIHRSAAGHPGRRRARPAAPLPWPRHLLVARPPACWPNARRRSTTHPGAPPALAPAHRLHRAAIADLNAPPRNGVRIVGRLGRIADGVAQFSGRWPTPARSPT